MHSLLVIDYTHDFVVGALPVGQSAIDIGSTVAKITDFFCEQGDLVIMAVDIHEKDDISHPEATLFPSHNVRGTKGRQLYGPLDDVYGRKKNQIVWMDKTRYSAFCGTDLFLKLQQNNTREVHLIGLCTDICVLHTAVEAYNLGYKITVYEDAVASFNTVGHTWALEHFRRVLGASVVQANDTILSKSFRGFQVT